MTHDRAAAVVPASVVCVAADGRLSQLSPVFPSIFSHGFYASEKVCSAISLVIERARTEKDLQTVRYTWCGGGLSVQYCGSL